ncbi:hypothetical protein PTKIN_Ptkin17bG0000400 [Pterospermum kingtungense]
MIIRNSMAEIVGALATPVCRVSYPLMVEALAAMKDLEFAKDIGFGRIVLKGDSSRVIGRLNSSTSNLLDAGLVCEKGKMSKSFIASCVFIHTRRDDMYR